MRLLVSLSVLLRAKPDADDARLRQGWNSYIVRATRIRKSSQAGTKRYSCSFRPYCDTDKTSSLLRFKSAFDRRHDWCYLLTRLVDQKNDEFRLSVSQSSRRACCRAPAVPFSPLTCLSVRLASAFGDGLCGHRGSRAGLHQHWRREVRHGGGIETLPGATSSSAILGIEAVRIPEAGDLPKVSIDVCERGEACANEHRKR
jgi:hypothetical protein